MPRATRVAAQRTSENSEHLHQMFSSYHGRECGSPQDGQGTEGLWLSPRPLPLPRSGGSSHCMTETRV